MDIDFYQSDDWRRRQVRFPQRLTEMAQQAQRISAVHPDGYPTLNALMVGALQREVHRIQIEHNNGQPITPVKTEPGQRYRYGRPGGC